MRHIYPLSTFFQKSLLGRGGEGLSMSYINLIYSLINSLDNMNTNISEPEAYFELNFSSNLKEKEFVELFMNGLKRAKQNFKKENLIIVFSIF